MKRFFWIMMIMTGVSGHCLAQIASFNFSAGAQTSSGWTNVIGDPSTAVRSATDPSGISITSVSTANWSANPGGICAYNGNGANPGYYFPTGVMIADWFQYNGSSNNLALYNALLPQLEITGLNKDSTYIIRMSGSDYYSTDYTFYTVAGATVAGSQSLNIARNATQGVTFQHVQPDTNGMIKVYVNCTSSTSYAFICGLQVFSGSSNVGIPVVTMTAPANGSRLAEGGSFPITATATETGGTITKVEFYADTTKIGEADAAPYTMTWNDPDPGNYQLTAKATDNVGTISTASVNIAIQSLNYFWSTTGNIATGADSSFVGTVDTNRLAFRTNNLERMTILKDGTIGIGTKVTDGYLLAVNGTAIFTKIKVKAASNWPDYVFGNGYKLPALDSLDRFVRQRHHLPGIASEEEVKRNGIDVSEQQAALLKKLEEQTLYLIDQNKKLAGLASRVSALDREMERLKKENAQLKKVLKSKRH